MTAHQKAQIARAIRLFCFTLLSQLPVLLREPRLDWRNVVALAVAPALEVVWRSIAPATPDSSTASSEPTG